MFRSIVLARIDHVVNWDTVCPVSYRQLTCYLLLAIVYLTGNFSSVSCDSISK